MAVWPHFASTYVAADIPKDFRIGLELNKKRKLFQ